MIPHHVDDLNMRRLNPLSGALARLILSSFQEALFHSGGFSQIEASAAGSGIAAVCNR